MYLSTAIDNAIEKNKCKFVRRQSYSDLLVVLNNVFDDKDLSIKMEKYEDFDRNEFSFTGLYDMYENKKYVVINLSKNHKKFELSNKIFKDFKFLLSQVIQHESIHQCQWSYRPEEKVPVHVDFRDNGMGTSKKEEQLYLSNIDEIEAYGHDLALEIKHFYPNSNPFHVLRYLNRYKKLSSFFIYKRVFKNIEWQKVKTKLLKHTYKWIKTWNITH